MTKNTDNVKRLIFNVLDWREINEEINIEDDIKEVYIIKLFGRTSDNKSVYARIEDYIPHFYVEIPDDWNTASVIKLIEYIKKRNNLQQYQNNLIGYDIVKRHKLYGFTANKEFNFIRLVFNNSNAMKAYARAFDYKIKIHGLINILTKFKIYESNIDSFLRFMHIRNLNACGWLEITNYSEENPYEVTTTDYNIVCKWTDVFPYESNTIAKFKICSFDIECTSCDGQFPQANRINDKIIQIGSVFNYYNDPKIYKKVILALDSCDIIEDANTITKSFETEEELLLAWKDLIIEEDPDVLTGYNIWFFDEKYMYDRARLLKIDNEFSKLGRIKDIQCKFVEKTLSSSALGDNIHKYYEILGRIQIDLMKVIQKDHKLLSYKLDYVSEYFTQEQVNKIEYTDYNEKYKYTVYTNTLGTLKTGNYIKFNFNNDTIELNHKYKTIECDYNNCWFSFESKNIIEVLDKELIGGIRWGLVKDDIKANDIFRLQMGTSKDRQLIAIYCIQDCVLVSKILAKLEIITNHISMANVCHVPFNYLLTRGQGIKSLSLVSKKCRLKKYLIPVIEKKNYDDNKYEGAIVFDPVTGFYRVPIPVLDYNSLYPSSIISKNVSHECIVLDSTYDNLPNYIYNDVYYYNDDGTQSHCRYAQLNDKSLGIIPSILQELLSERKNTKKEMKNEKDPFRKSILDGKQLALKITANSIYGQLGAPTSQIYMKELAASTTAIGRGMLEHARKFVQNDFVDIIENLLINKEEIYNKYNISNKHQDYEMIESTINILKDYTVKPTIIYGDTDSIFINMGITKSNIANEQSLLNRDTILSLSINLGKLASIFIKPTLQFPHNLEYEKTFYPFCIFSKKRYIGNKYEDSIKKYKQSSSGIVLKRRDNANIVKKIIGGLVNIMLDDTETENINELIKDYMKKCLNDLLNGKYPIQDFITTKTIRGTYKGTKLTSDHTGKIGQEGNWKWYDVKCSQAHVMLAQRIKSRDPGNAPQVNDRIPSVIIYKESKGKLLQWEIIEHPDYVKENKLKIDYLHYLTNQIMNPALQFLELVIDKPKNIFSEYINKEELRRKHILSLDNWFKKDTIDHTNNEQIKTKTWDNWDHLDENIITDMTNTIKPKRQRKTTASKIYSIVD